MDHITSKSQKSSRPRKSSRSTRRNNKLIQTRARIRQIDAKDDSSIGYTSTALTALAGMPHREIQGTHYVRINGKLKLTIVDVDRIGLPFGTVPRLIIAYVVTEAVVTKNRKIEIGEKFAKFFETLEITPSGGRCGSIERVKEQTYRLCNCTISITEDTRTQDTRKDEDVDKKNRLRSSRFVIAKDIDLLWEPDKNGDVSHIKLSKDFYDEIKEHSAPFDLRALKSLSNSPMAIDLYLWSTYRNANFGKFDKVTIPLEYLLLQFGAGYPNNRAGRSNFQRNFKIALKKVEAVYPGLNAQLKRGRLVLKRGRPSVPKLPIPKPPTQ